VKDQVLTGAELVARQVYWRSPLVVELYGKFKQSRRHAPSGPYATVQELEGRLQELLPAGNGLVLVHSSSDGILLAKHAQADALLNPLNSALAVLGSLIRLVGSQGTLVMPTHPAYDGDPGFMHDKSHLTFTYDPQKTPSRTGLLSEVFRRRSGTRRSLHPLSSLAVAGPLGDDLLKDNLNREKPLPHGAYSSYYRFCRHGGLVISLGVSLIKSMTLLHCAEEVRDQEWPIKGFAYERTFHVVGTGEEPWIVRERRPQFVRYLALGKVRRDLLKEGILHESVFKGIRLDWARGSDVLEFMMARNARGYPYYPLPFMRR